MAQELAPEIPLTRVRAAYNKLPPTSHYRKIVEQILLETRGDQINFLYLTDFQREALAVALIHLPASS